MGQPADTVDLDQAKHDVVHQFPGGARRLAQLAGKSYGVLCNKVNPLVETHHLTVDEAVSIQFIAGDCRIHEAEGVLLGRVSLPVGTFPDCSDVELLDSWAGWQAELGETAGEIRRALGRREISRAQVRKVRREMYEDFRAALALLQRLEALADDD